MSGFLAAADLGYAGIIGSLCIVTRYKFKRVLQQNRLSLLPEWNTCLE
ncbi:hypothetical protein [Mesorhizobium erdmanii]|nr:hypothetical protein [Mesorhizobium erdmanii]